MVDEGFSGKVDDYSVPMEIMRDNMRDMVRERFQKFE